MLVDEECCNPKDLSTPETYVKHVSRVHVHKHSDANVFIGQVQKIEDGKKSGGGRTLDRSFRSSVIVNKDHPFFFERNRGHVTGLYLIEAGRQMGMAVPHLFYDVTMDNEFILEEMSVKFHGFASLSSEIVVKARMSDTKFRGRRLASATFGGSMVQSGNKILDFSANIAIMPRKLMQRLEGKASSERAQSVV